MKKYNKGIGAVHFIFFLFIFFFLDLMEVALVNSHIVHSFCNSVLFKYFWKSQLVFCTLLLQVFSEVLRSKVATIVNPQHLNFHNTRFFHYDLPVIIFLMTNSESADTDLKLSISALLILSATPFFVMFSEQSSSILYLAFSGIL